jgi:hypothetical protein
MLVVLRGVKRSSTDLDRGYSVMADIYGYDIASYLQYLAHGNDVLYVKITALYSH